MRIPIKPKTSKLDTKDTPSLVDPTLGEIKHLFNADLGVHSLMSEYLVRPQSYSVFWPLWGAEEARAFILVPPQVVYGFVEVLGSGHNTTVSITARETDDTLRGSTSITFNQGSEGTDDDTQATDEITFVQNSLQKAFWVSSETKLQFRSLSSWDAHPMCIKFSTTAPAYANINGFCIHWMYNPA